MGTNVIDTLELADQFKEAGFEEKKAKVLAAKIGELGNERLVTRNYLDTKLESELAKLKVEMLKMMLGQAALIIAFLKVF